MENLRSSLLNEIDEYVTDIKNTNEYKRYLYLLEKLNNNEEIKSLIEEIKNTQKDIVKLEIKNQNTKKLKTKLNALNNNLEDYPLYVEFLELQKEIDNNFQLFKITLESYLSDITK